MGLGRTLFLPWRARRLGRAASAAPDLAALFELAYASRAFRPTQVRAEFLAFLARVHERRPLRVAEIGTGRGGTAFLLARAAAPGAVVVTVDREHRGSLRRALPLLAPEGGRIVPVTGDSATPEVAAAVREAAGGPLDLLFVDGDHSLPGVRKDHETYGPLVRPGGLIAFHDILPDHAGRTGRRASSRDTGGVPVYWAELKARHPDAEEFIADPAQDGFGLGLLPIP
ncbi:MAG: class I SAM-dependent methyltransferase [Planctomycetes bacterium]|nr:class I SAM-dependent methyltransferase [Planctomycetota bacterium]